MLARSDFRCCCSRAEVSGRGQDFRNPTPTRTPVVNHSMRQTCRVTDFAAFGARSRSRTVPCTCRIQYRASQTSHRSSPRNVGDLCLRTAQDRNVLRAALHRWAFSALPILLQYHRFRSCVDDVHCRKVQRIIVQNCQNRRTVYPPISLPADESPPKWQWRPSARLNNRPLRRRRLWSFPPHSRA